jgi:hypothetical protein
LPILVDESATGGVSSDRLAGPVDDNFASVAYAFATGVRGGVRMMVAPSLRKTSSGSVALVQGGRGR